MARVVVSTPRIVERPASRVTINGAYRADVYCLEVREVIGLNPGSALLSIPRSYAGDNISALREAEVVVYAKEGPGLIDSTPVFRGWVAIETARETASSSDITVEARDVRHLLNTVYVGQEEGLAVVEYPKRDRSTRDETGWRLSTVLEDMFSTARLPSAWRSVMALGDMTALRLAQADLALPDISFPAVTYREAIRQLLGLVPDVGLRLRFTTALTRLDFFFYGGFLSDEVTFRAPLATEGPEEGAVVTGYASQSDGEGIVTRVIGYGRPHEIMLTVSNLVLEGEEEAPENPERRGYLFPAWDSATAYYNATPAAASDPLTPEDRVLKDPTCGRRGSAHFREDCEFVFRLFQLPPHIAPWSVLQRNAWETFDGRGYNPDTGKRSVPVQIFRKKRQLALELDESEEPTGDVLNEIVEDEYELISGTLDERGFLLLSQPAIVPIKWEKTGGDGEITIYEIDEIFLTITVRDPRGGRVFYDTGRRGNEGHEFLASEGRVHEFINESLGYVRIGSTVDEFGGSDGYPEGSTTFPIAQGFGCTWYDPGTDTWYSVPAGVAVAHDFETPPTLPVLLEDDRAWLANAAERSLSEMSRRRTQATINVPAYMRSPLPGDRVRLLNRGINDISMTVIAVTRGLGDPQTTISASDAVPMVVGAARANVTDSPTPGVGESEEQRAARFDQFADRVGGLADGIQDAVPDSIENGVSGAIDAASSPVGRAAMPLPFRAGMDMYDHFTGGEGG